MKLVEFTWSVYEGGGVFSTDIHPTGKKLAFAGQNESGGGLITIWDTQFIDEIEDSTAKNGRAEVTGNYRILSEMKHQTSLNCIRWSKFNGGSRFVVCGDEPTVYIYEFLGTYQNPCSDEVHPSISERYKCILKLSGHEMEVTHADWSVDGKYLASCSLDNNIIIWNNKKLPEQIITLNEQNGGHQSGVKGLSWDPVGRYLATQSEECLKIWKIDNWECVESITDPFKESSSTQFFSRMDWSPDGSLIVAPCSMNNGGPTAQIINRKNWDHELSCVGFRKATTCVRSHRMCFTRQNNSGKKSRTSYFAIGSRDRSLSIWGFPNFSRPLVVLEKLSLVSILDIAWHGYMLTIASRDGKVKILKFAESELGLMLEPAEMGAMYKQLYGITPASDFGSELSNPLSYQEAEYNRICGAIAGNDEPLSNSEIFHRAFNRHSPLEKYPNSSFLRIVKKSQEKTNVVNIPETNFPENPQASTSNLKTSATEIIPNKKRKRQSKQNTNNPPPTIARIRRISYKEVIKAPKQMRLLAMNVKLRDFTLSIEVHNEFVPVHDKITRISAYRQADLPHRPSIVIWRTFIEQIVSLLAANGKWVILTTFMGCLMIFSAKTGRLLLNMVLKKPPALLHLKNSHLRIINEDETCSYIDVAAMKILPDFNSKGMMKASISDNIKLDVLSQSDHRQELKELQSRAKKLKIMNTRRF